jgi:Phage integrase family
VSEATGAGIENLGIERGHRTLVITRKGGKVATIPLAPRTARAIDLAIGERIQGPIFSDASGQRLDRHDAGRIVRRIARRAGLGKNVGPHTLRHAFITAALDAGVPLRDVQEAASHADPRTTMRFDRARASLDRHATYIVAAYLAGGSPLISTAPPGRTIPAGPHLLVSEPGDARIVAATHGSLAPGYSARGRTRLDREAVTAHLRGHLCVAALLLRSSEPADLRAEGSCCTRRRLAAAG